MHPTTDVSEKVRVPPRTGYVALTWIVRGAVPVPLMVHWSVTPRVVVGPPLARALQRPPAVEAARATPVRHWAR